MEREEARKEVRSGKGAGEGVGEAWRVVGVASVLTIREPDPLSEESPSASREGVELEPLLKVAAVHAFLTILLSSVVEEGASGGRTREREEEARGERRGCAR